MSAAGPALEGMVAGLLGGACGGEIPAEILYIHEMRRYAPARASTCHLSLVFMLFLVPLLHIFAACTCSFCGAHTNRSASSESFPEHFWH